MSDIEGMKKIIECAFEEINDKDKINYETRGEIRNAVDYVISNLDNGTLRVVEKQDGKWITHQWLKKAILLRFRLFSVEKQPFYSFDKIPLKCEKWTEDDFRKCGARFVPGAIARKGAYIESDAVLMPSYINIGARIGGGTMIDTWATVGTCAQVGRNCHISGGVGLGGVLEPLNADPVIIEDNCFIGARSEVAEGVIVEEGSVLAMGVFLGKSTRIFNRQTGEISYGKIPRGSVVVPGSLPDSKNKGVNLYCAVIVKEVDEGTRSKVAVNDLLRGCF